MEIDRQKLFLGFLKACSYLINGAIIIAILAFVVWYMTGLFDTTNSQLKWTR